MTYRIALVAAMVAIAAAGGAVSWSLAQALAAGHNTGPWTLYAVSAAMPLHLVQLAPSAAPLTATLVTFTLLGLLGVLLAKSLGEEPKRASRTLAIGFGVVSAVLLFSPVVYSLDIFLYDAYGLLYGAHGVNPYDLFPMIGRRLTIDDPALQQMYPIIKNPPFSDPYGPLWTLLAGAAGALTRDAPLLAQLYAYRVLAIGACACAIGALWRLCAAGDAADRASRVARFAFHPLVLYECCVGAHNDILMVAPALWSFVLIDELPLAAGVLAGAAIGIKFVAVAVLPFLAMRAYRRGILNAVIVCGSALIVPLALKRLFAFDAEAGGSLLAVGSGVSMSINWLAALPLINAGILNAPVAAGMPWLPLVGPPTWGRFLQLVILAAVAVVLIISIRRYHRTGSLRALAPTVLALVLSVPAMHPWYGIWQAPFIAARGAWATFSCWFCALLLLVYVHEAVAPMSRPLWVLITAAYLLVPAAIARLYRPPVPAPALHLP